MKILAIDPIGVRGHKEFNATILRVLMTIGQVTFVAPHGYTVTCAVTKRIDIPTGLSQFRTKIGARWSQIRTLDYILKKVCLRDYDAVVFLAYDTISFCLSWPRKNKVFLFEHNNIDASLGSLIKTFFYRHLSPNAIHLTFQEPIAQYIQDTFGMKAVYVPHPYYRSDVNCLGFCPRTTLIHHSEDRKVVFSPSLSTPKADQNELKNLISEWHEKYYLICKGVTVEKTDAYEVLPFFHNYEDLMHTCDIVFLGARFDYRVSGVAYEALSYAKPVVLLNCAFARTLQREFPHLVFSIDTVKDLSKIVIDHKKAKEEAVRFLREHSLDTIRTELVQALNT